METNFRLEAWSFYYEYEDGTSDSIAGLFSLLEKLEYPLLNKGCFIQLGNNEYRVHKVLVEGDGSQTVSLYKDIGYNRYRADKFKELEEMGWILIKEYNE